MASPFRSALWCWKADGYVALPAMMTVMVASGSPPFTWRPSRSIARPRPGSPAARSRRRARRERRSPHSPTIGSKACPAGLLYGSIASLWVIADNGPWHRSGFGYTMGLWLRVPQAVSTCLRWPMRCGLKRTAAARCRRCDGGSNRWMASRCGRRPARSRAWTGRSTREPPPMRLSWRLRSLPISEGFLASTELLNPLFAAPAPA